MCKRLVRGLLPIAGMICLVSCHVLTFYSDADKPIFRSGKGQTVPPEPSDSLNVVTFNIKKSRKIKLAISEMKRLEKTAPIDIYLLQEMSEKGVEALQATWT